MLKTQLFHHRNKLHFKYIKIENSYFKLNNIAQYYGFCFIFIERLFSNTYKKIQPNPNFVI